MELIATIDVGNTLGECVLWCARSRSVWWTDIEARTLYRLCWESRRLERFQTPERLCSFGFTAEPGKLIAAFESGFALYDAPSGGITWIARPLHPGIRLNDGRVDREGRFWAGSMAEDPAHAGEGQLFCLNSGLHVREEGLTISNSICWSPDGAWFYFADSAARTIWRYAFDSATGAISDKAIFAQTPEGVLPDGSVTDAAGFLWNAQWGAGRVARYAPDGRLDRLVDLPARQPTCVAFGGPDLNHLIVTSARAGLASGGRSVDGSLFIFHTSYAGLPETEYRTRDIRQPIA
jgi:sugar lactone lactonase YvrE